MPINVIVECTDEDDSALLKRFQAYQSVAGSINWLTNNTLSDLDPTHSFLSSYNNRPSIRHWKEALYGLHHIYSTHYYGILSTLEDRCPLGTYRHFPMASDAKSYDNMVTPSPSNPHQLSTYSDICWGPQIGNVVKDGISLPL